MEQKTVFISYRRTQSKHLARSIYMDLKANGWDVFFDINSIDSGDFDKIILNQVGARAHFILLISTDSLTRCVNDGDWVLREIQEAVRLGRNIVPIIEEGADFNREVSYLPLDLRAILIKKSALSLPNDYFEAGMDKLRTRFLKTPEYISVTTLSISELAEVHRRMMSTDVRSSIHSSLTDILSAPFNWIDIPTKEYSIAKYPITNAQFSKFIEAGGYKERKWWTDLGWEAKFAGWDWDNKQSKWISTNQEWTQPRYWTDAKWNSPNQPVVGVSWYESLAFCFWLSDITGQKIMLPTEDQWQYAAQGDDGRSYPWGNDWDCLHCNNSVKPCNSNITTSVTRYEGKGDSPFAVVDMVGNVWEWCLTDHENKINSFTNIAKSRVLRGGAWYTDNVDFFRCDFHGRGTPHGGFNDRGFRISRS
ncbi:MAG: SUMF1/EgtB/PvdO family nonheme iron enzyme [Anaerolineaceae bacterium]|nr:SUMF1/EgtB/PvdO family nonheme iron enzyme [Anaerolineaceae bacterium]